MSEICGRLHYAFNRLHPFQFPFDDSSIPSNGIYVLFETGETAHDTNRVVRVGTHTDNEKIYIDFFHKSGKILRSNGYLVALTQEKKLFGDIFDHSPIFQKIQEITVEPGGLLPSIFIYKKQ